MKIHDSTKALIVRVTLLCCITISVLLMYYVNIIQRDYYVYTNPDGPDLSIE